MAQKQQSSSLKSKLTARTTLVSTRNSCYSGTFGWNACSYVHAPDPHNPLTKRMKMLMLRMAERWEKIIMEKYNKNNPNVYSGDDKDSKTFLIPLAFTISEGFSCMATRKIVINSYKV